MITRFLIFLAVMVSLVSCRPDQTTEKWAIQVTGGDPHRARAAFQRYGCVACHTIEGMSDTEAMVGPPLIHMASRSYLAGMLQNNSENMMRWIRTPHEVNPKTAMPNMGVTEQDARDMASYLYSYR